MPISWGYKDVCTAARGGAESAAAVPAASGAESDERSASQDPRQWGQRNWREVEGRPVPGSAHTVTGACQFVLLLAFVLNSRGIQSVTLGVWARVVIRGYSRCKGCVGLSLVGLVFTCFVSFRSFSISVRVSFLYVSSVSWPDQFEMQSKDIEEQWIR